MSRVRRCARGHLTVENPQFPRCPCKTDYIRTWVPDAEVLGNQLPALLPNQVNPDGSSCGLPCEVLPDQDSINALIRIGGLEAVIEMVEARWPLKNGVETGMNLAGRKLKRVPYRG